MRDWGDATVTAPASREVDVTDRKSVRDAVTQRAYDLVINCTAFNQVVLCESDPAPAFAVNAFAVSHIAQACYEEAIPFVTFSTDYVFAGDLGRPYKETDAPRPINAYGISKLAGEFLAFRFPGKVFVIRTCGVYGTRASTSKGYTFIDQIINKARAGETLKVVNDQIVSPTYTGHIATALKRLIETERYGLYHMVNSGAISWYDFAGEALRRLGIQHSIEAISSDTFASAARRPPYSALENAGIGALGIAMPDWRDGIASYLQDKTQLS